MEATNENARLETMLQFVPFTSAIDSAFWHLLTQKKLDEYGLSDEPVDIVAYFNNSEKIVYNFYGLVMLFNC